MGEYLTLRNGIILYLCLAIPVAVIVAMRLSLRERRILREGHAMTARVAAIRDTGARHNKNPVAELTLDIEGEARQVVTTFTVPNLFSSRFQPGCQVALRVDPRDPNRVIVDRKAMGI